MLGEAMQYLQRVQQAALAGLVLVKGEGRDRTECSHQVPETYSDALFCTGGFVSSGWGCELELSATGYGRKAQPGALGMLDRPTERPLAMPWQECVRR